MSNQPEATGPLMTMIWLWTNVLKPFKSMVAPAIYSWSFIRYFGNSPLLTTVRLSVLLSGFAQSCNTASMETAVCVKLKENMVSSSFVYVCSVLTVLNGDQRGGAGVDTGAGGCGVGVLGDWEEGGCKNYGQLEIQGEVISQEDMTLANSSQMLREDLEQIDPDDLEEMDLQWEMAMLTTRARRFIKRIGRQLDVNGKGVGFDRSKVECYNCHKYGHFARECRLLRNQEKREKENNRRTVTVETPNENALVAQDGSQFNLVSYKAGLESVEARLAHYKKNEAVFEESINVLNLEVKLRDNALVENKRKLEKAEKERDELKLTLEKFQNSSKSLNNLLESQVVDKFKTRLGYNAASSTAASHAVESFVNTSKMLENQEHNKSKSDKGYHAVPPPFIWNFIPYKPDLTFMDEIVKSENMDITTIVTPSNVKTVESNLKFAGVKSNGDAVEPKTIRENSFRPPVIMDWNFDDDSEVEFIPNVTDKTVRPSTEKIKFVNSARETVEKVIRLVWNNSKGSGKINTAGASVNTAGVKINTVVRPVNTAGSKPTMNHPRSTSNAYKKGYSQVTRPFNTNKNSIFNKIVDIVRVKDTTARDRAVVSENKGIRANAVKASA
ncbi:ribonuclease H-like domain-containing protein [Tanacetum coccineum]